MSDLSHFDEHGASRMVDVGGKPETMREASASGLVEMQAATLVRIRQGEIGKGNVLEVARLAAIMGAKRTWDLIPLCHPIALSSITIAFSYPSEQRVRIEAQVRTVGRTGVEMEALTAVAMAGLTIFDMCKAIDRSMVVKEIRLEEKSGGKSGHFLRDATSAGET